MSLGDPKKQRKKFDTPRFRWRKDILQEELKLLGQYGLRNKHELWRHKTTLTKARGIARSLISKTTEERAKMENELLSQLKKKGVLQETAVLDNVLDLIKGSSLYNYKKRGIPENNISWYKTIES